MGELTFNALQDGVASKSTPFKSTTGEWAGAAAAETWDSLPVPSFSRQMGLNRLEQGLPIETAQRFAGTSDPRNAGSDVDAMALERGDAPVREAVSAEDAKALAKSAGVDVKFDKPLTPEMARSVIDHHVDKKKRAEVIANYEGGAFATVGEFGIGMMVSLADPLNVASMFIPIVPGAFVADKLARAATAFGRAAIRGGVGAVEGAVGMAMMEPLTYAMSKVEYDDYTATQVLERLAFGAVLGAGGHMLLGGLFGQTHKLDLPPEVREGALKAAVAQVVEGRPVDVMDILHHGGATHAAKKLELWFAEQQRIRADRAGLRADRSLPPDRRTAVTEHESSLAHLREQARQMRGEAEVVRSQSVVEGMDPETRDRLDAVNLELDGTISKARRAGLSAERDMLMEGRGEIDLDAASSLEKDRTASQIGGLDAAAARAEGEAQALETKLEKLRADNEAAEAAAEAARNNEDRAVRIGQARNDSREAALQNLMERDVRKFAAEIGVKLEDGEARTIAKEIRTAQPEEAGDIIVNHLNTLAKRSSDPSISTAAENFIPDTTALRAEAAQAAKEMAERAAKPHVDPEVIAAERANAERVRNTPEVTGDVVKDLAASEKAEADMKAQVDAVLGRTAETEAPPPKVSNAETEAPPPKVSNAETFKGTIKAVHGSGVPDLTSFSRKFSGTETEGRYDFDGGELGGEGLYLDEDGQWTGWGMSAPNPKWTEAEDLKKWGDLSKIPKNIWAGSRGIMEGKSVFYHVEATFRNALVLTPDNIESAIRRLPEITPQERARWKNEAEEREELDLAPQTRRDLPKIAQLAKRHGYDGLILRGWDTSGPDGTFSFFDPRRGPRDISSAERAGVSSGGMQDQIMAFYPERLKIVGKRTSEEVQAVLTRRQITREKLEESMRAEGTESRRAYEDAMSKLPRNVRDDFASFEVPATPGESRSEMIHNFLESLRLLEPQREGWGSRATPLPSRASSPFLAVFRTARNSFEDGTDPTLFIVNSRDPSIIAAAGEAFPGRMMLSPADAVKKMTEVFSITSEVRAKEDIKKLKRVAAEASLNARIAGSGGSERPEFTYSQISKEVRAREADAENAAGPQVGRTEASLSPEMRESKAELDRALKEADDLGNEGVAAANYAECMLNKGAF